MFVFANCISKLRKPIAYPAIGEYKNNVAI